MQCERKYDLWKMYSSWGKGARNHSINEGRKRSSLPQIMLAFHSLWHGGKKCIASVDCYL